MKRKSIALLALFALLLSVFSGCGETPEPEPVSREDWTAEEYESNPVILAANKVSDTVLRVSFSAPVRPACREAWRYVTVGDAAATAMALLDLRKDETYHLCATVYEFTFPSPIAGEEVRISGTGEGNTARALTGVFCGGYGEGLYAPDGEDGAPYASVSLTDAEIPVPDVPTAMVGACRESESTVLVFFSKPIQMIKSWDACGFFADDPDPSPGMGNSWQEYIRIGKPVDEGNLNGVTYAQVWRVTLKAAAQRALKNRFFSETVYLRISENDAAAVEEYGSDWNNEDIGRVASAIDGSPVLADYIAGWDVAYVPVETDPFYIPPFPGSGEEPPAED